MSQIKNGGLDQYGVGPFEQQQFGTSGVKGVNSRFSRPRGFAQNTTSACAQALVAIGEQVGSLLGWRCYGSYADVGNISSQQGDSLDRGRHKSDIHTIRWEIYRVYTRSLAVGYFILDYAIRKASGGCPAFCGGENLQTNIHTYIDR